MRNMNEERRVANLDITAPIDFETLKREMNAHGPLCLSSPHSPYQVILTTSLCRCADEGCNAELLMVSRKNGLFEMQWVISKDYFLQFESIDAFRGFVTSGELQDSRGERMIVEEHIDRAFQKSYYEIPSLSCVCSECLEAQGREYTKNMFLLSQLAELLRERAFLLEDAREWDEESSNGEIESESNSDAQAEDGSLEKWTESAFELGYAVGRNFSEYAGKAQIEALALLGIEAKATKKKRELAAGEKSRKLREERRAALFEKMELIAARSPDVVKFGADAVAKLALDECIQDNAAIWSQGRGQVSEYLGEIRRCEAGQDIQKRYQPLFGSKPPKRLRGIR